MFVFTLFWGHAEDSDFRCWKGKIFIVQGILKIWKAIPLCVLWTIWQERNGRDFGGVDRTNNVIKQMKLRG